MAMVQNDFWKLAVQSRLLSPDKCRRYQTAYAQIQGVSGNGASEALAQWLVAQKALSTYQARVLLSGRPGPFVYGPYRVYDRIATGRLKGLFRAHHAPSRQSVSLYFLSGPALSDPAAVERVRGLAVAAAALRQSHLCQVLELFEQDGCKFVVLEDLRGKSAAEQIASQGAFTVAKACRTGYQAALGLWPLHKAGQTHGEICPDNLWLLPERGVKLLGFPLARDPLATELSPERLLARADYLAPELFETGRALDPRSDVYSLGCTLYFLLTGRAPFPGGELQDKQIRHTHEEVEPADHVNPLVPPRVVELLGHLMAKRPAERYPQAAAVAEALKPLAADSALAAPPPLKPPAKSAGSAASFQVPGDASTVATLAASDTSAASRVRARHATRRSKSKWAIASASLALLVVVTFLLVYLPKGSDDAQEQLDERPKDSASADSAPHGDQSSGGNPADSRSQATADVVAQATETIRPLADPVWRSPTSGDSLDLRYLPPGGQLFLALRPAELLAHPEGAKLLNLPGPLGPLLQQVLPDWCGVELHNIDQVVVSLSADAAKPFFAGVVRLSDSVDRDDWLAQLADAVEFAHPSGETLIRRGGWIYYTPDVDRVEVIAIVADHPPAIEGLLDSREQASPLRREMETLLKSSDAGRHMTLLLAPNFLFSGGRWLFDAEAALVKTPLREFLGDDAQAALLSFHLDDDLFTELRVHGASDVPASVLAQRFAERVSRLPVDVEDHVVSLNPGTYSRRVLLRYPQMIQLLSRYTRVGTDGEQVVLRGVLPVVAAHNLWLGSHLAMLEAQPAAVSTGDVEQAESDAPLSVAERLRRNITLSFPRHSLDRTLELLGEEMGVKIQILGGDLQLEGITKNQPIELDERDRPAVDILMAVLKKANPDGKLVFVIGPSEEGSEEMIFVTTRAAVARRGESLPAEFEPSE